MVEEKVSTSPLSPVSTGGSRRKATARTVNDIEAVDEPRIAMPSQELNRVLGGGLVKGSIVLIGGEPGVGKSTLVLQNLLSIRSRTILYVSGEESPTQIKLRADRIGRGSDNLFIVGETSLENIFSHIEEIQPQILVVDSIQTIASEALESSAGSVGQVRECAAALLRYAKDSGVPVILIGHITKEGSIADGRSGPLGVVHLPLDGAHGGEAGGAQQVENHERVRSHSAKIRAYGGIDAAGILHQIGLASVVVGHAKEIDDLLLGD